MFAIPFDFSLQTRSKDWALVETSERNSLNSELQSVLSCFIYFSTIKPQISGYYYPVSQLLYPHLLTEQCA